MNEYKLQFLQVSLSVFADGAYVCIVQLLNEKASFEKSLFEVILFCLLFVLIG